VNIWWKPFLFCLDSLKRKNEFEYPVVAAKKRKYDIDPKGKVFYCW